MTKLAILVLIGVPLVAQDTRAAAATEYFRSRNSAKLGELSCPRSRRPDAAGATKQFKDLMGQTPRVPFLKTA